MDEIAHNINCCMNSLYQPIQNFVSKIYDGMEGGTIEDGSKHVSA